MIDASFFVPVSYPAQAKRFDFFSFFVCQTDMFFFYYTGFFRVRPVFRRAFVKRFNDFRFCVFLLTGNEKTLLPASTLRTVCRNYMPGPSLPYCPV
jgi:hypothetical protein